MPALTFSDAVAEADWVRERLSSFESHIVSSVVPGGFEAYARVLHPAEEPRADHRLVRWAEVAAWSDMPLRPDSQFHSIALPPHRPSGPAPWSSQGPAEGQMYLPDIDALAEIVRDWTETPASCWFCLWHGWGDLPYETPTRRLVELIITAIGDNGFTSGSREGCGRLADLDLEWRLTRSLIGLVGL